jgi:hypothetical protein
MSDRNSSGFEMNNGELQALAAAFPQHSFRSFPKAKHDFLRVQAGHLVVEDIALPPNDKTGFAGFAGRVTRFHLKAFAPTVSELAEVLSNGEQIAA